MDNGHRYDLRLTWTGAEKGPTANYMTYSREYSIEVAGKPALRGSADPAYRGDPALHNPEDMLLAALSACHMLSYLALCTKARIKVVSYQDAASGSMAEKAPHRIGFTEVVLRPRVAIAAGGDAAKAKALHEEAHELCFIANSVNFPVRHEAEITIAAA
jgi:organic hydroperoxide reductase OsmC/OhrA